MSSQNPGRSGHYDDDTTVTDDPEVGEQSSDLKDYLTNNFLSSDNSIQWRELAGATVTGLITAVATGFIRVQKAFAAVVDEGLQPIEDAAQDGGSDVAQAIVNASDVWGVMDVGPVTLLVNGAIVLVALFAFSWVISRVF